MLQRTDSLRRLAVATARAPITALLGPRQCGKTTLARQFAATRQSTFFDLESEPDVRRLANPELVLGALDGLVVLDEIQRMPRLFDALRVLVDRDEGRSRFLVLGSASPDVVRGVSESLAGRVEFIELAGFDLAETACPREDVVTRTDKPALQRIVTENTAPGATVYTDEAPMYVGLPFKHDSVKPTAWRDSVSEYVRVQVHTNGTESFWSLLKRGYVGIYHKMSPKPLNRYARDAAGTCATGHHRPDAPRGRRHGRQAADL